MRALALYLDAPMQSWGGPTVGDDRPSLDVPTKSGVVGMLASSLGYRRHEQDALVRLTEAVKLVVRVDAPGVIGVDYHTAQDVPRSERGRAECVPTKRQYLFDAAYTVLVIEAGGAGDTLERFLVSLRNPRFAPYLGRRSCPPARPLLATPNILDGVGWREILELVPPVTGRGFGETVDVYVERGLAEGKSVLRRLRWRDELYGSVARLFRERHIAHSRIPASTPKDSVEPWFPR